MTPIRASITGPPLSAARISASMAACPSGRVSSALGSLAMYSAESPRMMNAYSQVLIAITPVQLSAGRKSRATQSAEVAYKDGGCRLGGLSCSLEKTPDRPLVSVRLTWKTFNRTITLRNPSLPLDPGALAPLARISPHQSWGRLNAARTRRKYSVSNEYELAHRMPLPRLRQRFSSRSELVFDKLPKLSRAVCAISWRN